MIEPEVEARVCASIERALAARGAWAARRPAVRGLWRKAAEERRGPKLAPDGALVVVGVSPRAFDTFGIGTCEMSVSVKLSVRIDLCPAGAALDAYAGPIAELLQEWNRTMGCENPCGLDVPGAFTPGGLWLTGGEGPNIDDDTGVWSVTYNFTLRGVVVDAEREQPETGE